MQVLRLPAARAPGSREAGSEQRAVCAGLSQTAWEVPRSLGSYRIPSHGHAIGAQDGLECMEKTAGKATSPEAA